MLPAFLVLLASVVAVRVAARLVSNRTYPRAWPGQAVTFTVVQGVHVPSQPWPASFFVARELIYGGQVELRPLTAWSLLAHLVRTEVAYTWWSGLYLLRAAGFLHVETNELWPNTPRRFARAWRWAFWRTPTRLRWHDTPRGCGNPGQRGLRSRVAVGLRAWWSRVRARVAGRVRGGATPGAQGGAA